MERFGTIHDRINARSLARKLIDYDPKNSEKSLARANRLNLEFERFLDDTGGEISKSNIIKKSLEFVHRSARFGSDAYLEEKVGEFTASSFYDTVDRILKKESQVGNCQGLSSVVKFLLDTKGIESRAIGGNDHIFLIAKEESREVFLETTLSSGYNDTDEKEIHEDCVVADFLYNLGSANYKQDRFNEAINAYTEAIKINPRIKKFYLNRGYSFLKNQRYPEAASDFKKYSLFNEENDVKMQDVLPMAENQSSNSK